MANTTRFMIEIPDVGVDADAWGNILNNYFNALEPLVFDKRGDIVNGNLTVTGSTSVTTLAASGALTSVGLNSPFVNGATTLELRTAGTTKAMVDNAGNLGLGVTPSPSTLPVIESEFGLFSGRDEVNIIQSAYFASGAFRYSKAKAAGRYLINSGIHQWFTAPSGTAGAPISFTQAMALTQGGNLLVGTTVDSNARLTVVGGGPPTNAGLHQFYNGGVTTGRLATGASLGVINNFLDDSTLEISTGTSGAVVSGIVLTAGGAGAVNPNLVRLYTGSIERARITSAGYFKASNTGAYGNTAGLGDLTGSADFIFQTNGTGSIGGGLNVISNQTVASAVNIRSYLPTAATGIHFSAAIDGAVVYRVLANGNVQNTNNSYGAISDIKLKENITDATPKLENLNKLRVVNYNLKADESKLKQIGLIAQEVEQIFPGLVEETPDTVEVTKTRTVDVPAVLDEEGNEVTPATTTEETYTEREPNGEVTKAVKYSVLVPMLLKAVQELSAQNAALESRLAALEAK